MGALTVLLTVLPKIPGIIARSKEAYAGLAEWFKQHSEDELNAKLSSIEADAARQALLAHIEANN